MYVVFAIKKNQKKFSNLVSNVFCLAVFKCIRLGTRG